MTDHKDLKRIIRERQSKTGESYTTARAHVMRERAHLLEPTEQKPVATEPLRADAAVLKVNRRSARVRICGESGEVTFKSEDVWDIVPGQIVTLVIAKRWSWKGDDYGSGQIESPRIDIEKLGLVALPLSGGDLVDLREVFEPFRRPDPYAPLWRKLTATSRADFAMDPIAWGRFPGAGDEGNPTCDAAELAEVGDYLAARELLMETLGTDLRCLDAHAHLGNLEFEDSPERAFVHYEIGVRIGEQSLPPNFDGLLLWGHIYNRPFLRCLHGCGLCLWRMGRLQQARQLFERILSLNPNDNQGVRVCWEDVRNGRSWEEMQALEESVERA